MQPPATMERAMDFEDFRHAVSNGQKRFYVVIHVEDTAQAIDNAVVAFNGGADGIFLIDHKRRWEDLYRSYRAVRGIDSKSFIGLNFLDLTAAEAFSRVDLQWDIDALWVDDPGDFQGVDFITQKLYQQMKQSRWPGKYFASAAFKGQPRVADVAEAARLAAPHAHVVVTSGPSTGFAPDVEKIRTMKAAIGDHPLAIASGMTPENIELFLPHADIFMVATGISSDFATLDSTLVRAMADKIHGRSRRHTRQT